MTGRLRRSLAAAMAITALGAGVGTVAARTPVGGSAPPATSTPTLSTVLGATLTPATPESPARRHPNSTGCPAEEVEAGAQAPASTGSTALATSLAAAVADPGFAEVTVGASIWVEGYGEVLTHQADLVLHPGSNEKLLTAMGALAVFEPDDAFSTTVLASGQVAGGTLDGDLVLVGGGDPTLATYGHHSLDGLAAQVRAAGITAVVGGVVADETHFEPARLAPGWQDWQLPAYVGPMSALTVDDNRHRVDPGYLADPAVGNAELFLSALSAQGVAVVGGARNGSAPEESAIVASLTSPPVLDLVGDMLLRSDNETAEAITREAAIEVGTVESGTTTAGTAALTEALALLCVALDGRAADGSGLSRANLRSAREWRLLLQAARTAPWWQRLHDSLPLAGRTGTLRSRFVGTSAEANVRAKTGTIIGGRALSGYLTTVGGRSAVFSVVVNGDGWERSLAAIDRMVATVAADIS